LALFNLISNNKKRFLAVCLYRQWIKIEAINVRTIIKTRVVQSNKILNYLFLQDATSKNNLRKDSLAFCTGYCRRIGCCGGYLGPRKMRKQGSGDDCIMKSFTICAFHQILIEWSSQEEWGGRGMGKAWGKREKHPGFWGEIREKQATLTLKGPN
jgi:hypothetical protein